MHLSFKLISNLSCLHVSVCAQYYKGGLSRQLHVVLHLWLRQAQSCKFLAFGSITKSTIPVLALLLHPYLGVCC